MVAYPLALHLERFAKHRVDEGLELERVALGLDEFGGQLAPARVRAVAVRRPDVETHQAGFAGLFRRPPLPGFDHVVFLRVLDDAAVVLADVVSLFWLALWPGDARPFQVLVLPTVWARHEVSALVGVLEHAIDPAGAFDRRRAAGHDLAVPEILGPANAKLDLVALGPCAWRVAVDLVEQHHPARHTAKPTRAVGTHQRQGAAGK